MNRRIRKALTWLLCGGAFVGVVMSAAGCAMFQHDSPHGASADEEAKPQAARVSAASRRISAKSIFDNSIDDREVFVRPSMVNVFGEFDGKGQRAGRQVGETGFQQHTFLDEGYDADVCVSPDGKWLLFASTRHNEHADIYLQRVDGLSVVELTNDDADDAFPTFSPDGKRIAFCSTRGGTWHLYLMDTDGKNITQITSGPMQDLHPSFSPDGKRLVYCSCGGKSGQWELWTVSLETGEKRMIGYGLFPSWSPDRTRDQIAFQRARQRGSRWFSLWTLDLIDNEAHRMTEIAVSNNAAIVSPAWSPDGRRLTFVTIVDPGRTSKQGKPQGQQDIWTINVDGTNRQRLTDGNGSNVTPCWGADGRIYFISDRDGTECVWSVGAHTSGSLEDSTKSQSASTNSKEDAQ